jgi:hypothetical protein
VSRFTSGFRCVHWVLLAVLGFGALLCVALVGAVGLVAYFLGYFCCMVVADAVYSSDTLREGKP